MAINSRAKGKVGELEWAAFLRDRLGCDGARRGQQRSGTDCADVIGGIPGTHAEVKRVENLNVYKAMEQAVADAMNGDVPYVAHRKNRKPWLVTVRAEDLVALAERLVAMTDDPRCHECGRSMLAVSGGVGNVNARGALWCGCVGGGAQGAGGGEG